MESGLFHSHQATEKSLKALVASTGESPPKTHSLADLLTSLEEFPLLQELKDELFSLESYYIPTRYPDALPGTLPEGLPGEAEAREAYATAVRMLDATRRSGGSSSH